ncbi:GNAT family N-acetyltransferase [Mergibacter septicus]|uniref:GNAT family N-acetyltransferase n=1 Tax=Mergibacter septicus TaxID=221402 RepID=A0A8E3SBZ6_9PAST|nr:GNAT family N-acetyltransferase [Mergibacter septicus]AWX15646.1 GNAT family N-acetyltransferase [Mergibacter septicus]QDJ13123.1 GNAT family N-acetyltransferase [Mergibacter septicus]QDJ14900.1 GNAT family N-acetyltransferase [Mergibacter septicus]UTU47674.1 GNAT family N-acetyltransferase [Mergibacter septicus]WMR96721.1 GNAT family N-acetyltransferase [Mergibacter septicus]
MQHQGTQILTTKRLILRPFCLDDSYPMFKNWASDPEVTKYLTWQAHSDQTITLEILNSWVKNYQQANFYQWAIVLKESGEVIGSIGAVNQNESIQEVEIGYCIGKAWWQQGITSEALAELIRFFFLQVNVNRIVAKHDSCNPNSGKVMQKVGMQYEGRLRQSFMTDRGLSDKVYYSILRSEFVE